jgi:hypothetical protein
VANGDLPGGSRCREMFDATRRIEQNGNMSGSGENDFPVGYDTLELRFIWLPENHDGQRPGYPWFEAGWMAFAEAKPSPESGQPWQRPDVADEAGATPRSGQSDRSNSAPPADAEPGDMTGNAVLAQTDREAPFADASARPGSSRPGSYGDAATLAVSAAVQALDALAQPDPRTSLLDAESQRNAVAKFATPDPSAGFTPSVRTSHPIGRPNDV